MKIAIVLGRGVEGCGITRLAIEYKNWLEKNDYKVDVFVLTEKSFSRSKSQPFDYKSCSPKEDVSTTLNKYNKVVYLSIPSITNSKEAISNFIKYWVNKVNKPKKVFIQGDHLKQSLNRNARMWDVVEKCDLALTFSKASDFGIEFEKRFVGNNLSTFFGEVNPSIPLHVFRVGMDFTPIKEYRKSFSRKKNRISYFGRFARFKHPERVLDLRKNLKKQIIVEMRGLERSIGALDIYNHPKIIEVKDPTKEVKQTSFTKTYVSGPYIREDGMEEISKSKFGCSFYELEERFYGSHVEYAMLEIVGLGLIPIFSKHWGDNTKHISGKPFSSIKYSGIYLGKDNIKEVCEEIENLNNNESDYEKYVDKCINIYKEHASPDKTWGVLQERIDG
jgi:hypothetical protein